MKSQQGGIFVNTLMILILVVAIALAWMLARGEFKHDGQTIGQASPTITQTNKPTFINGNFSDGLGTPDNITRGTLDEFGAGIDSVSEFNRDINNDGAMDKITRTHVATGNDHDYDEYKIELNNNGALVNITPRGFRTTRGADCALRLIRFDFAPNFHVTIISRPFQDTWDTPSVATKTVYDLDGNVIVAGQSSNLSSVCDVTTLF
ncbi:MAG: hypothetical protein J6L70_04490 [Alphaproteobacteria bacterium]|nr:hypothetical protein [Alphaproteobacteria bacterium]